MGVFGHGITLGAADYGAVCTTRQPHCRKGIRRFTPKPECHQTDSAAIALNQNRK